MSNAARSFPRGISSEQLDIWSNPGALQSPQTVHTAIRSAIEGFSKGCNNSNLDIFLQGSYQNSTHVRGSSDVDVVVQLTTVFKSNEIQRFSHLSDATYGQDELRADCVKALGKKFGTESVIDDDKCIKLNAQRSGYKADIVPCISYKFFSNGSYYEGIYFQNQSSGVEIVNFPKYHLKNGEQKNVSTDGRFKDLVRIFKNARDLLVDRNVISNRLAPSYFVECLLFNADNSLFALPNTSAFPALIDHLLAKQIGSLTCQNGIFLLIGDHHTQWNKDNAANFLFALQNLWFEGV